MASKNTICLWYDGTALDAARFYAETFADSSVGAIHRAPRALTAAIAGPDRAAAKRAFEAMMQMGRIDIAAIEKAQRG